MKKSIISLLIVFLLASGFVFAKSVASENKDITDKDHDGFLQISSMSLDILQYGLTKPGAGLNYNFEKYLGNHLAVSGIGGGGFFFGDWFSFEDLVVMGSCGVNFRVYPLHDSLRGLYIGGGAGGDAMFYFGNNTVPEGTQKYFAFVKPEIGWKFYLLRFFMIDVNMNYKWQSVIDRESLPEFYQKYLDDGFHFGIGFKFFWN